MTKQEALDLLKDRAFMKCAMDLCDMDCQDCYEALYIAIEALEQEPIIRCKDCKHWHEWDNGTGSCHISDIIWVGTDLDDYCSFAEQKESDTE